MFRARKSLEVPAKRSTGLLSPRPEDLLGATKRQRLSMAPYSSVDAAARRSRVLVDSPECAIELADALPAAVSEELRREWPSMLAPGDGRRFAQPLVVACRARVPSARHRSGAQVVRVYVFVLRAKVLLWRPELRQVVSLPLPDELERDEVLHPFLLPLDGQSLSLLMVGRSGSVLFWEDIELPYDSIPLSVQIPLQPNEFVATHADAVIGRQDSEGNPDLDAEEADDAGGAITVGVICWSNQGSVWEVAMDDRRLRVRAFEKQQPGLLAGLTKSVTSFFFSSGSSRHASASTNAMGSLLGGTNTTEVDPLQPIKYAKVVPSSTSESSRDAAEDSSADLVVLYKNGIVERRQFSSGDVLDCTYETTWSFDASRVALTYFSDTFPRLHLAKIAIVAVPYVNETRLALLVAFVCASKDKPSDAASSMDMESGEDTTAPRVKYVLFQFSMNEGPPEPEWACVLDYEPVFADDQHDANVENRFFDVESFSITRNALYLVWPGATPIQVSTIVLPHPDQSRQSSARSAAFSLQGIQNQQMTFAFGARADDADLTNDRSGRFVRGSLTFLLLETASTEQALSGSLCIATASNMQRIERASEPPRLRFSKSDDATTSDLSSHFVPEHLDVEEYVGVLMAHFQRDPLATSPLRVNNQDVSTVAQAVIALDMQILDARSSSGLRWGKNDTSEQRDILPRSSEFSIATPKLVKYQLEEKRARHVEFMRFLERRCASVWSYLEKSPELKRYLMENEEKIRAATALSKLQANILSASSKSDGDSENSIVEPSSDSGRIQRHLTGHFLLHAIEATVERRGYNREQLQLAGYNAFDVFYCEVSKLSELFQVLDHELDALAASIGDSDPTFLQALLETGYAVLCLISAPPADDKQVFVATGSWVFGARQVREVLVNHITRLSQLIGYSTNSALVAPDKRVRWPASDIFLMGEQIRDIGSVLLSCYSRLGASEDLRNEYSFAKRAVLNPLVYVATTPSVTDSATSSNIGSSNGGIFSSSNFEVSGAISRQRNDLLTQCVSLCEKHSYFEGMVFLAFVEDRSNLLHLDYILGKSPKSAALKRFESYLSSNHGFDEFVFRWYAGEVVNPWAGQPDDEDSGGSGMSTTGSGGPLSTATPASTPMIAYLLANSSLFANSLHSFMKQREQLAKYRWMTAISLENYDQASSLALHEAVNEQWSLTDRKTMTSIAKIAALAGPTAASPSKDSTMHRIDRELKRGKIQELLLQLPLTITVDAQPMNGDMLVRTCLEATLSVAKDDPLRTNLFLMTLDALDTVVTDSSTPPDESDATVAEVWRCCLSSDQELWEAMLSEAETGVNEEALASQMRQSLLFLAAHKRRNKIRASTRPKTKAATRRGVYATPALLETLVQAEYDEQSIVSARALPLFVKTLHLAVEA